MIRQATTPRAKLRFYNACRGKLCLGATMPLALELLGKSQPGRFFAGPTLALDIGGSTAWGNDPAGKRYPLRKLVPQSDPA